VVVVTCNVVVTCTVVVLTCTVVVVTFTLFVLTCFVMCGCVGFVLCVSFGNMFTCIYCVLYCLYCVLCIVSFMYTVYAGALVDTRFSFLICSRLTKILKLMLSSVEPSAPKEGNLYLLKRGKVLRMSEM
jgi:hypothetical protein